MTAKRQKHNHMKNIMNNHCSTQQYSKDNYLRKQQDKSMSDQMRETHNHIKNIINNQR